MHHERMMIFGSSQVFNPTDAAAIARSKAFRQMDVIEGALLAAFLQLHGAEYDAIALQVQVGRVIEIPAWANGATARQMAQSSRQRADAFLLQCGALSIVEVKAFVAASTLRQLNRYRDLWQQDFPDEPRPLGLLIGQAVKPGLPGVLARERVTVRLFPNLSTAEGEALLHPQHRVFPDARHNER